MTERRPLSTRPPSQEGCLERHSAGLAISAVGEAPPSYGVLLDEGGGALLIVASVLTTNLAILVLAGFVGFIVISKIPNTLHTPLMSGTNAIHGIVLVGALLLLGLAKLGALSEALLVIAVMFGTINIVGGFFVTDRMLDMFKAKKPTAAESSPADGQKPERSAAGSGSSQTGAGG